jgi:hypothetical protein
MLDFVILIMAADTDYSHHYVCFELLGRDPERDGLDSHAWPDLVSSILDLARSCLHSRKQ